jgi:valyl-tRNA synthetase
VLAKLHSLGLFVNEKEHEMTLPVCSRSGDIIEPFLKEQWFANSSELFKVCGTAVDEGTLQLIPESRKNLWSHYVNTFISKDWCISRQLWWGQRIPAYKCHVKDQPVKHKWFGALSVEEAREKAVKHFNSQDLEINQGLQITSFF